MYETQDREPAGATTATSTASFREDDSHHVPWPGHAFSARDLIANGKPDPSAFLPWIDDDLHIDHSAPRSSSRHGVRTEARRHHEPTATEYAAAQTALQAAADIVQHDRPDMISSAAAQYQPALRVLYLAATGERNDVAISGTERIDALDSALHQLDPAIAMVRERDPAWVQDQLLAYTTPIRSDARYIEAHERVDNAVRIGENKVVEIPTDQDPHAQGLLLHLELQKLIPTMAMINEQLLRGNHDAIHHETAALLAGKHEPELGAGSLAHLQNLLFLADGWLTLNDQEFRHHLQEIQGVFNGVATYTELVKAVVELAGGALEVTAAYTAAIAKLSGNTALFASASGFAKASGLQFARIVAWIEIIHGVAVLLDPHATRQEKVDGAVGASSGAAWFIGKRIGGTAIGAAASTALLLGYGELKLAAYLYWHGAVELSAGFMHQALRAVQRDGDTIAQKADALAKTGLLLQEERDPEKAAALKHFETNLAVDLGEDVDYFIDDCQPHGVGTAFLKYPGNWEILREAFAPVMRHRGARSVEAAIAAGNVALDRITWVFAHAGDLVIASTSDRHLGDVEAELAKKQDAHGSEE